MVVIGAQGGEWPYRGPIFGVDANTGETKWEFVTVAGTEEAKATWGGDSWRTGGGGGWLPGTYDPETDTIWWGTANPAPTLLANGTVRSAHDRYGVPPEPPGP